MKIGIISDTHDHHDNVYKAIDIFNRQSVDIVFHAGDIVSPFTVKAFKNLKASRFIAVYGNNDGEKLFLRQTVERMGGEIHEYCYKEEIHGKHIYMTHTHHNIPDIVKSQSYDLVIYGHTHEQDIRTEGRTLVVNPGESTQWIIGKAHVVIVDFADMSYEIIRL